MPEGDTIRRAAVALDKVLAGKSVTRFTSVFPALAPAPTAIDRVTSLGKHILMHFSDGRVLRTHMRMSGSWHIYRPGERWHRPASQQRILIETPDFVCVAFSVHDADFAPPTHLGPDLLADDFDAALAFANLRASQFPILDALLDQRIVAGIGNVYKSELLFWARVHPLTPVPDLDDATLKALIDRARKLLKRDVAQGHRAPKIYDRAAKPCPTCGTPIASASLGKDIRRTYWCPQCQKRAS